MVRKGRGARCSLGYLGVLWSAVVLRRVLAWVLGGPARSTQRGGTVQGSRWTLSHTVGLESWLLHWPALTSEPVARRADCLSQPVPLQARRLTLLTSCCQPHVRFQGSPGQVLVSS